MSGLIPVIVLLGNGLPVLGSVTGVEKIPFRSFAVGTLSRNGLPSPGWTVGQISWEKKKKSLFRPLLKLVPGINTGPPILYPIVLKRFWLVGCSVPFQ